jgi:hypothetical protein
MGCSFDDALDPRRESGANQGSSSFQSIGLIIYRNSRYVKGNPGAALSGTDCRLFARLRSLTVLLLPRLQRASLRGCPTPRRRASARGPSNSRPGVGLRATLLCGGRERGLTRTWGGRTGAAGSLGAFRPRPWTALRGPQWHRGAAVARVRAAVRSPFAPFKPALAARDDSAGLAAQLDAAARVWRPARRSPQASAATVTETSRSTVP